MSQIQSQELSYDIVNNTNDIRVVLPEKINDLANERVKQFVDEMSRKDQSHNYYKENRNIDPAIAMENNIVAKKAEIIANWHLRNSNHFPAVAVDFSIREDAMKGWDADLPYAKLDQNYPNVHVKSTQRMYNDDYTWTFQWANNNGLGGRDTIFSGPDTDLVVFVFVENPIMPTGIIKAILPWGEVKKCLVEPFSYKLKRLKKCVWLQDLKNKLPRMLEILMPKHEWQVYIDERRLLSTTKVGVEKSFDKWIITIASSGFGACILLHFHCWTWGWIAALFLLSLSSSLISLYVSRELFESFIDILDCNSADIKRARVMQLQINEKKLKWLNGLNKASIIFVVLGLLGGMVWILIN